jgi:uncharacterized protein (UPF0147 family)
MTNKDTKDMIRRVISEIKMLRAQNAELAPKAHAYDTIAIHARLLEPKNMQGYGQDIVWQLENELKTLEQENAGE